MVSVAFSHLDLDAQQTIASPKSIPKQISQNTHIFKSKLPDIPITNTIPLHTYCFQKLPEVADRPCLISAATGKIYTYAETHHACRSLATGLYHNLGIRKGDVIMILLPNSPEFVFSFMAVSMLGAIATTANPAYTSAEIMKQIKASKAKMIITQAMQVGKIKQQQEEDDTFVVVTVDDQPENCMKLSEVSGEAGQLPEVDIHPDDTVALPFSSGTTGLPKGVVLTHKSLLTSVAQTVDGENPNLYYTEEDVLLCLLPLFHIYAMHCVMFCALRRGSAMLLVERFEMNKLLELIERHRASVAMVVPPLVLALAKNPKVADYDLTSIRMVMCGAAPLGKDLEDALRTRLPQAVLAQAYGMTESGPVISMSMGFAKNPLAPKSGSCGTIVRNAELKIVDVQTGDSLPYNMAGEICIRGEQIMKGYLNDEKATSATIDLDGWLHTGDIGYVDSDHDIFIVDRVKEIIKFKGFQVPPAELEALLLNHPSIADAAVVPKMDDVAGEVPVAFVVRSSDGYDLTEDDVKDFIAKQVVFYKRLQGVYFIHAIPKSPSGKISRKELKAKLATSST